jgi:hypothetical protein
MALEAGGERTSMFRAAGQAHQSAPFRDGHAVGPLTTDIGPLLGRGAFFSAPSLEPMRVSRAGFLMSPHDATQALTRSPSQFPTRRPERIAVG